MVNKVWHPLREFLLLKDEEKYSLFIHYNRGDLNSDAIKKRARKKRYESNDIFVTVQHHPRLLSGARLLLLEFALRIQAMASQFSKAHLDIAVPLQDYEPGRQESSNFEPIEPLHATNRWGAQTP